MNAGGPLAHLISEKNHEAKPSSGPCAICGKPTEIEGWIVGILRTWNENLNTKPGASVRDVIRPGDIEVTCSQECNATLYKRKHDEQQRENAYSIALLAQLHAGHYSPETLYHLRQNGYAEQVARALAKTGTTKANP